MAVEVTTEIEIDRPVSDVAAFAASPDNVPLWYANITRVEWRSPRPLRVGTELSFVARFLGRTLVYAYTVVEWVPGQRLVMRTTEGPFPMETTYDWQSASRGTRMTLRNRGLPVGIARCLAPLLALAVRQANRKDLARLKTALESRQASTAG